MPESFFPAWVNILPFKVDTLLKIPKKHPIISVVYTVSHRKRSLPEIFLPLVVFPAILLHYGSTEIEKGNKDKNILLKTSAN